MNELLQKAVRSAFFFMSALFALWALVPEGRTVAAGLLLGTAASIVNAFLLRRRVEFIGKFVTEQGPKRLSAGLASRLATVLLVVMAALRFPEHFAMPAVIGGCFYVQFAVFFTAIAQHINARNGKG